MGNRIQIREEWDRLTKEAARAKNAGITYGAWKARQYQKEQEEIARKEREFRAYKQRKERERQERREQRRKAREGAQEKKKVSFQPDDVEEGTGGGLKCVQCGRPLPGRQKLYCCKRCEYIYNAEKLKRDRIQRHNREKQGPEDRCCPVCGEKILGDIRRVYCCDTCKYEMRKRRRGKNT